MNKFFTLVILLGILFSSSQFATAGMTTIKDSSIMAEPALKSIQLLKSMNLRQVQTLIGRKLSFKEKVGLFAIKHSKIAKTEKPGKERITSKKGRAAFILGISAFGGLLIPILGFLAIPAAILAIIFGAQAIKADKNDVQGRTGMILGIVFMGIVILAILVIIALFASLGIE